MFALLRLPLLLLLFLLYFHPGPFNSWDRVPYITTIRNGTASIIPAFREIRHNFMLAVYSSQEAVDNVRSVSNALLPANYS